MAVRRADGDRVGDAGMQSSHARGGRASARRQDIANSDVADGSGVNTCLLHGRAEHARENLLRPGVLEAALLRLRSLRQHCTRTTRPQDGVCPSSTPVRHAETCTRTFVIADRTAATMTTSLSFCVSARALGVTAVRFWMRWVREVIVGDGEKEMVVVNGEK